MGKFMSVGGNFHFLSKLLNFEGVGHLNEFRNLKKKFEFISFHGLMNGRFN